MSDKIRPSLRKHLDASEPGPFSVIVEFSQRPEEEQARRAGLTLEGLRARGSVPADRIRALAMVPEVVWIDLDPDAPAASPAPRGDVLYPDLQLELQNPSRQTFNVLVSFRKYPQDLPPMRSFSVRLTTGTGQLTRSELEQLAAHPDVVRIQSEPILKDKFKDK